MKANDYSEALLGSIKLLTESYQNELNYDRTIVATIIDDEEADSNTYQVSYQNSKFTAFSSNGEKYNKNDTVYVLVPQGNMEGRKIITGKYTTENQAEQKYLKPFDRMLKGTENMSITLLASDGVSVIDPYIEYYSNFSNDRTECKNISNIIQIKDQGYEPVFDHYDYIGLSTRITAPFTANNISGLYRICLYIKYVGEDEFQFYADLRSDEMFGNPYLFDDQKIEWLFPYPMDENNKEIDQIQVHFESFEGFTESIQEIQRPIDFADCNLCFGYDEARFTETQASITLRSGTHVESYNKVLRDVEYTSSLEYNGHGNTNNPVAQDSKWYKLQWIYIHPTTGKKYLFPIDSYEEAEITVSKSIYWYAYTPGANCDNKYYKGGQNWARFGGKSTGQNEPSGDIENAYELRTKTYWPWSLQTGWNKNTAIYKSFYFPRSNYSNEKIKVQISYKEKNNTESIELFAYAPELKKEKTTVTPSHKDTDTLVIEIVEEGYKDGIFNIYDLNGKITTNTNVFTLKAKLQNTNRKIEEAQEIRWYLPYVSPISMIDNNNAYPWYTKVEGQDLPTTLEFKLKTKDYSIYKSRNNIECTVIFDDGEVYKGTFDLKFGYTGNNGTKYSFNIVPINEEQEILSFQEYINLSANPASFMVTLENENRESLALTELTDSAHLSWEIISTNFTDADINTEDAYLFEIMSRDDSIGSCTVERQAFHSYLEYSFSLLKATLRYPTDTGKTITLTATYPLIYRDDSFYNPAKGMSPYYINLPSQIVYDYNGNLVGNQKIGPIWSFNEFGQVMHEVESSFDFSMIIRSPDNSFKVISEIEGEALYLTIPNKIENNNITSISFLGMVSDYNLSFWALPIEIYQNSYLSENINLWDSNEQNLDNDNNSLTTKTIIAGTKNNANQFTGVISGDVQKELNEASGLYGFNNGIMTFALSTDGTGKIGPWKITKDGFEGKYDYTTANATGYVEVYITPNGVKAIDHPNNAQDSTLEASWWTILRKLNNLN